MSDETRIRRQLAALAEKDLNYDPGALDLASPPVGWQVDDRRQALPGEAPGPPARDGSWEIAQRLVRGYEFADPSMVRAHYDPDRPLEGRNMLLELRTLGVVRVYVGVRVAEVYDERRTGARGDARVFGWSYRTLEGHVEMGQMNWEVWKWNETGEVEFRVHAVARPAPISNPFVRIGFLVLRGHERRVFLDSTSRRMLAFTELGLEHDDGPRAVARAGPELTARRLPGEDHSHERLARKLEDPDETGPAGGALY
jgi:uncharacterized protein (UPF0548 family)